MKSVYWVSQCNMLDSAYLLNSCYGGLKIHERLKMHMWRVTSGSGVLPTKTCFESYGMNVVGCLFYELEQVVQSLNHVSTLSSI